MKIAIIGYSGSGKSTLARELSERFSLPVCYLDRLHWLPGWQERPKEESAEMLCSFMDENSETGWVIDGNYTNKLYERRMQEADIVIFMNFSRLRCLYRIIKRNIEYRGRSRFSMTDGCNEKIDREFVIWTVYEGRKRSAKREEMRALYPDKFREIRNPKQLKRFMAELCG